MLYFDQFDRQIYNYEQRPGGDYAVTLAGYDARGRIQTSYNPFWSAGSVNGYWGFGYDALDRITSETLYTSGGALNRSQTHAYNGLAVTTTDFKSNASTRYAAAWGDLAQVMDAASGATKYKYNPFGQLTEVKDAYNNVTTSVGYNVRGMKLSSTDMDMGFWEYEPNALGEVRKIRDAKISAPNWTTEHLFDALGRMTQRTEAEGITYWTWGTSAASYNIGRLASVSGPGYSETLTYDNKSRLSQRSISTDATYLIDFGYHAQTGLLDTLTYPESTSGHRFKLQYEYAYGMLSKVKRFDAPNTEYWKLNTLDARGNVLDELLGNGTQVISTFDPLTGLIEARTAGPSAGTSIQNLDYEWDLNANLWKRKDVRQSNLEEVFSYDTLNRVTGSTLNGSPNLTVAYDLMGNITSKDGSTYTYHASKKHAVTAAAGNSYTYDANGNVATKNGSTIAWTSHNYPSSIAGSGVSSQFWYGPDRQRFKQVGNYSGGTETTHYVGGLLEKLVTSTRTHFKHYIAGPNGLVATYTRRTDATEDTFYFTKDHLGSIDSVTNQAGAVQVRMSFEAFGRRRNEAGWSGSVPIGDLTAIANTSRRSFTEHEFLDNLGLIHMNGRVQDPTIGRFLSADPNVPDPTSGQSFNRYSYVRNNPLSVSDPSGFKDTFRIEDNFGNAGNSHFGDRTSLGSGARCSGNCGGDYMNGTFTPTTTDVTTWECKGEECGKLAGRTISDEEAQRMFDIAGQGGARPAEGYNRDGSRAGEFVLSWVPASWEQSDGDSVWGEPAADLGTERIGDMGRGVLVTGHTEATSQPNFAALGRGMLPYEPGMEFALGIGTTGVMIAGGEVAVGGAAAVKQAWSTVPMSTRGAIFAYIARFVARLTGQEDTGTLGMPKWPSAEPPAGQTASQPYTGNPPLPPTVAF